MENFKSENLYSYNECGKLRMQVLLDVIKNFIGVILFQE